MNWEKSKSLTPLKHDFLVSFFKQSRDFFLTGGSALGIFYFDHRRSYDLDLFTLKEIDWHFHERMFIAVAEEIEAEYESIIKSPYFQRYQLKRDNDREVIDFVIEKVHQVDKEKKTFDSVTVDTLLEIGVNKICTLLGRTEMKDIIDLYFLVKNGFDISKNIEKAKLKDGGVEPAMISYLLSQFKISQLPDYMIAKVSIEELEQFISDITKLMAEISYPE
ncbi:MAG: nucleotidyl transferase AbiEii/AbiGii toxin family protein [bacterium]|nr:nucleotidyl transferase AbiEii/AbiGii toxin family protein [bacterium]